MVDPLGPYCFSKSYLTSMCCHLAVKVELNHDMIQFHCGQVVPSSVHCTGYIIMSNSQNTDSELAHFERILSLGKDRPFQTSQN